MIIQSFFLSKLVAAGGHQAEIAATTVIAADIDVAAEIGAETVADRGHDHETVIATTDVEHRQSNFKECMEL